MAKKTAKKANKNPKPKRKERKAPPEVAEAHEPKPNLETEGETNFVGVLPNEALSSNTSRPEFSEFEIPIELVTLGDHQPRNREGLETRGSLTELKENIRKVGLLQPILVEEKQDGTYLLISGERRLRACIQLGHKKIRAVLPSQRTLRSLEKEERTLQEIALFENLKRKNLSPIEEGKCFLKLQHILPGKTTQKDLAERLGLDEAYVSIRIKCLELPDEVREMLEDERINFSQVRQLLRLKKIRKKEEREEAQLEIAKKIEVEKLTFRRAKNLVDELLGEKKKRDFSHLTKLGAKKAVYFISLLNEKFDEIELKELDVEGEQEKLDQLAEALPLLIAKLKRLEKEVGVFLQI